MAGSFLYYVTHKYVLLKDARLGVAYYLLAALIVLYTVVEIVFNKGYMAVSTDVQLLLFLLTLGLVGETKLLYA